MVVNLCLWSYHVYHIVEAAESDVGCLLILKGPAQKDNGWVEDLRRGGKRVMKVTTYNSSIRMY